jgi:plasmid stabilization system protein ParE
MKVRIADAARTYLRREAGYLRRRDPATARNFAARMRAAAQSLAAFPNIGIESEGHPVPGVRRLIVGDYLLDYEIVGDEVHVVAARHGRQSPPTPEIDPDFDYEEP